MEGGNVSKKYPELPIYMQHFTPHEVARYLTLSERGQKWVRFQHVKKGVKPLVAISRRLCKESRDLEKGRGIR